VHVDLESHEVECDECGRCVPESDTEEIDLVPVCLDCVAQWYEDWLNPYGYWEVGDY